MVGDSNPSKLLAAGLAAAWLTTVMPLNAAEDPIGELANAICAASDVNAITMALSSLAPEETMPPEDVGEAFGVATFLGDLQRCANRQAATRRVRTCRHPQGDS